MIKNFNLNEKKKKKKTRDIRWEFGLPAKIDRIRECRILESQDIETATRPKKTFGEVCG